MRHKLRFGLLFCVLFDAALATAATQPKPLHVSRPEGASPGSPGIQGLPSVATTQYPYFQTLKQYTFDNAGTPDPQGWTTADLSAQNGTYWHVDNFSGLSGYAPLAGSKSMWCGLRTASDPAYQTAPGYGDNWTQILESDQLSVTAGQSITLEAKVTYDVEPGFDYIYVEYRTSPLATWTILASLSGQQLTPVTQQWTVPGASVGNSIQFRFVMTSDYAVSDENFFDTHGAVVLDDLRIFTPGGTFSFETFESASLNATLVGIWHAVAPPQYGNRSALIAGTGVQQIGTPNNSGVWSFFYQSTATYACGGYPSQNVVPYTQSPGSTHPVDYLHNEARSPWIDLSVDQNNQAVDPAMSAVSIDYDVYVDLPYASNGVVFETRLRFMVGGIPTPWETGAIFDGGGGWVSFSTLSNFSRTIPVGATQVQVGLVALDYGYGGGTSGTCHSPAPLFDNVSVYRMYPPQIVTNTNNSGGGSLRQAITNANANANFNSIVFAIPTAGAHTINLASPLPAISNPVWIDGFTQAGSTANTSFDGVTNSVLQVAINGASAGANANGLWFTSGGYGVVRGLAIGGFSGAGVRYESTALAVTGCYIGTNYAGSTSAPNGKGILATTAGMSIGGKASTERMLISANTGDAIDLMAGSNPIFNCHVGYDASGQALVNGGGIHVFGGTFSQIGEPAVSPCAGENTDRVWLNGGNIVVEPAASGVMISQIRFDGGAIDLGNDGPTANDPGDTDSGANGLQNFPVLNVGSNSLTGSMDGAPNTLHHIEFYSGDGIANVTNYLGYQDVTTDGSGHANINFSCGAPAPGTFITATATTNINTSELATWGVFNNTHPGMSGIPINLFDAQNQLRATVQYTNIFSVGNTLLNAVTPSSVPIPSLWNVGSTPQYWDITNNVAYAGNVQVCLYYDPAQVPGPEGVLRLLHYQNGQWVDVTSSVDITQNVICGVVSSLSPFVIAKRTNATEAGDLPDTFALHANIPNPFNPTTTIDYDVRRGGANVSITIFDVAGRLVRTLVDEHRDAGHYNVQWNGLDDGGRSVSSGVYFYRMQAAGFTQTRKMVLLK